MTVLKYSRVQPNINFGTIFSDYGQIKYRFFLLKDDTEWPNFEYL